MSTFDEQGSQEVLDIVDLRVEPTVPEVVVDVTDAQSELTDLEMRILEFERIRFGNPGAKQYALSREFGISSIRYFQMLNQVIDRPEAVLVDPVVVNRLRRMRDTRRRMHGVVRAVRRKVA